jgi:glycosyltransferase involved in cell wall biosynthesis
LDSFVNPRIAVVIPSYRVRNHILSVISRVGDEVLAIYIVDDCCPEKSGDFVRDNVHDERVRVIYNEINQGVGGATLAGMSRASQDGYDVIVKIDGDGQMDPAFIPAFVDTIWRGEADYTKGNRFFEIEGLSSMPTTRLLGNVALSFMAKLSTGYWHTFDPTNGYIAIHAGLIPLLPLEKISKRYCFETDLLFRLNVLTARVLDIPMHAHYGDEVSSMKPHREVLGFAGLHTRNLAKRIFYNYFVRNFSIASIELLMGVVLCLFGFTFGVLNWGSDVPASAGTVMTAALPILIGVQLVLAFLSFDIQSVPRNTLHTRLRASQQPLVALRHRDSAVS